MLVRTDGEISDAIITGTDSAFCAGAYLGQLMPLRAGTRETKREWDHPVLGDESIVSRAILRNFEVEKPVIAAISGHAIARAVELVQGTDIQVSTPSALQCACRDSYLVVRRWNSC